MPRKTNKRKSLKGGFWPFSSSSNVSQTEQLDASGNPVKKGLFSSLFSNSSSKQQQPLQQPLPQPQQQPQQPLPQEQLQTIEKKSEILGGNRKNRKNRSNKKSRNVKRNKTIKSKK
jgi:hypothetical protein